MYRTILKPTLKRISKGNKLQSNIAGRDISISFYLMNDNEFNQLVKFDNLVSKMLTWLKFVSNYARSTCSKTLKVFCYMTPIKKVLPEIRL